MSETAKIKKKQSPKKKRVVKQKRATASDVFARPAAWKTARALLKAFSWRDAQEGPLYWHGVYSRLLRIAHGEKL